MVNFYVESRACKNSVASVEMNAAPGAPVAGNSTGLIGKSVSGKPRIHMRRIEGETGKTPNHAAEADPVELLQRLQLRLRGASEILQRVKLLQ